MLASRISNNIGQSHAHVMLANVFLSWKSQFAPTSSGNATNHEINIHRNEIDAGVLVNHVVGGFANIVLVF